jgi:hypothetical protein
VARRGTFDDVADQLYALAPKDFTAARTAAVKQARQDGDAELARQAGALKRPTVIAWLANQLVRAHPEEIKALLTLGESLRAATRAFDGEQLRKLAGRQQEVLHGLVQQGRALGRAAGQAVTEDTARGLEETLRAALADPGAAGQLAAGRLTGGLTPGGFPGTGPDEGETTAPPPRTRDEDERATAEAERAAQAQRAAQEIVASAEEAVRAAQEQVDGLRARLEEARHDLDQAEGALRTAHRDGRTADQAVQAAERRLAARRRRG